MSESAAVYKIGVKLDGNELPKEDILNIVEAYTHHEINMPGMFYIELIATGVSSESWHYLLFDKFNLGSEIEIFVNDHKLIHGEIYSIEPRVDAGAGSVIIRGYDYLNRLKLGKNSATFREMKDSEIVETLASNSNIETSIDTTDILHENIVQYGISDYQFISERSNLTGHIFYVEDQTLHYKKPDLSSNASKELNFPMDINSGDIRMSINSNVGNHVFKGWDTTKKETFELEKSLDEGATLMGEEKTTFKRFKDSFGAKNNTFFSPEILDKEMATTYMENCFLRSSLESVVGTLSLKGHEDLKIATNIQINGMGKFEGKYYLKEVKKTYFNNELTTELGIARVGV